MSSFTLAPLARDDLQEIWDYYAVEIENTGLADRICEEFFTAFEELARIPGMGHYRNDLVSEPLRFWSVRAYLVVYRSEKRPIEIARVIHAKRDVQALLE